MRFRFVLTCLAVALMCSSVGAQPGGGRGPGGRGPGGSSFGGGASLLGLLNIEAIQKELELADDQIAAIKKLQEELGGGRGGFGGRPGGQGAQGGRRPDGQGGQGGEGGRRPTRPQSNEEARTDLDGTYFVQQDQPRRNFQDLSEEERQKLIEERQKEAAERAKQEKEKLGEILLPHQMKRLNEIALQLRGTRALEDPAIAKELGITEAQQKNIVAAREKADEERRALFQGGGDGNRDFNVIREKMSEMRKKSDEQVLAVLNAGQKKKFEDMKGKPFEMPEGGGQGGGRRPGGQGGQGGQGGGQRPARPDA